MFKRVLFLLLIANQICAENIGELEQAIMKSDLPAVERLVNEGITVSSQEQIALMNLASEIVRKRENAIFDNERYPQYKKYIRDDELLAAYNHKENKYLLCSLASPFIMMCCTAAIGMSVEHYYPMSDNLREAIMALSSIISLALLLGFLGASIHNINQYWAHRNSLVYKHAVRFKERYEAAIKIKQLIFKIRAKTAYAGDDIKRNLED